MQNSMYKKTQYVYYFLKTYEICIYYLYPERKKLMHIHKN